MALNFTLKEDVNPVCPHCGKELTDIYLRKKGAGVFFAKTVVYFCPLCHKVLGVGRSNSA